MAEERAFHIIKRRAVSYTHLLGNPGVNPYNLQVGMKLYVCPGESYVPPQGGSANTGNTGNSGSTGNTGNAGNGGNTSNAGVGGNIGIGVVIPGGQRPGGNQTAGERQKDVYKRQS